MKKVHEWNDLKPHGNKIFCSRSLSSFTVINCGYSLHVVHAYHHAKSSDRAGKIKEAAFAVGSPIIASALSTIGASAFLFGCRTWVFIELGLLICSITAMALLYTMTFLFAWLAAAGPVPIFPNDPNRVHQWDLHALCQKPKGNTSPTARTELELNNDKNYSDNIADDRSEYSIEIVDDDLETDLAVAPVPPVAVPVELDSDMEHEFVEADYEIEITEDLLEPKREIKDQEMGQRPSVRSMLLPAKKEYV